MFLNFNELGLSHPNPNYISNRREYNNIVFDYISSNKKLDDYFTKLGLEYSVYGTSYIEGLMIFKKGQKRKYLENRNPYFPISDLIDFKR